MCDFRPPPTGIFDRQTNTCFLADYKGIIGQSCYGQIPRGEVIHPGIYCVAATGSHYTYFDGQNFHRGYLDQGRYEFLFPEGCGHSHFSPFYSWRQYD